MNEKTLSVFVDESGKFQFPDPISRFYIVSLVMHDQSIAINELIRKLFQLADMVCTVKLVQQKIALGIPLTDDEFRFFGGSRRFMRNVYKQFASKEF